MFWNDEIMQWIWDADFRNQPPTAQRVAHQIESIQIG